MASGIGGFLTKTTGSLPNWAWGLVIVAGAGVGYYFVKKNNASASTNASTAVATPAITDTTGQPGVNNAPVDTSGSNPVLTVPGGTNGTVPILPPGYTPIYDSQGNLIGWEPPGTPPPTQTPPPVTTPPTWSGTPIWSNAPNPGVGSPLIPQGNLPATQKGTNGNGDFITYGGQTYTLVVGAGGRLWGVPGTMSYQAANMTPAKILLSAPSTYYH